MIMIFSFIFSSTFNEQKVLYLIWFDFSWFDLIWFDLSQLYDRLSERPLCLFLSETASPPLLQWAKSFLFESSWFESKLFKIGWVRGLPSSQFSPTQKSSICEMIWVELIWVNCLIGWVKGLSASPPLLLKVEQKKLPVRNSTLSHSLKGRPNSPFNHHDDHYYDFKAFDRQACCGVAWPVQWSQWWWSGSG